MDRKNTIIAWLRLGTIRIMLISVLTASCAGPIVQGGEIYLGRVVSVTPAGGVESVGDALTVKETRLYRAVLYTVTGDCDAHISSDSGLKPDRMSSCQVRVADLGVLPLAAPDRYYKIRYRGVMIWPAVLSIELNDNSTLRSIRITEDLNGHDLYIGLGPLGPGIR